MKPIKYPEKIAKKKKKDKFFTNDLIFELSVIEKLTDMTQN